VYVQGQLGASWGTSLAAPIWGGVITLVSRVSLLTDLSLTIIQINEARSAVGKGPVGFINPVLYQHPEVLNDIKNGSNPGCHSEGFHAVKG
jgi:tripeptidyl-peptidase-1